MAGTLFTYTFGTDPAPLQAGVQGRLNIGVTAPAASGGVPTAYCNKIQVAVPVEGGSDPLFAASVAASLSTNRWSVSARVATGAETGLSRAVADSVYTEFFFDCSNAPDYSIDYGLALGVAGSVATTTGTGTVVVGEHSGSTPDPSGFTLKETTCSLATVWPQFYLENFIAAAPGNPTLPCSAFAAGSPVSLSWESNGSYFEVYVGDSGAPAWHGTDTLCQLPGYLVDTTCILVASLTGPASSTPSSGFEPVYRYGSLTITILQPQLTPDSVTVGNGLTAASVGVSGQLQAGSADVSGQLRAATGTFANDLTVAGSAWFTSLDVGVLRPSVGLDATGAGFSALGSRALIAQGSTGVKNDVEAVPTDGLALLQLMPPNSGQECAGYGWITVGNNAFGATGGSRAMGNGSIVPDVHCVLVPIPAATAWSFGVSSLAAQSPCPMWQLFWFPLGAGRTPTA
jgi:hypothetical protein